VKEEKDKLAVDHKKVKAEKDKLDADHKKVKAEKDKLDADHKKVKAEKDKLADDHKKVKEEKDILAADNNQFKVNNEKLEVKVQQLNVELGTLGSDANLYQEIFTQIKGNVYNAKAEIKGMAVYELPGIDSLALEIQDMENTLAGAIIQDPETPSGERITPFGDEIMPNDGGTTASSQVVGWQSYPSNSGYYVAAYEDMYPSPGDYDFNDLAAAYRLQLGLNDADQVVAIRGNAYLIARGAGLTHDWHLRIGLPPTASGTIISSLYTHSEELMSDGSHKRPLFENRQRGFSGDLDLLVFADSKKIASIKAPCYYFNTEETCEYVKGPLFEFRVELDTPLDPTQVARAPFDPYLFVRGSDKYEIHLPDQKLAASRRGHGYDVSDNQRDGLTSFIDEFGFPFAIIAPDEWCPPYEMVDLADAYPDSEDIQSAGDFQNADWYKFSIPGLVQKAGRAEWEWSVPTAVN